MTTDNRHVAVYLPADIEKAVEQFALERGLTRKDKSSDAQPAWGTAVVSILKEYFTGNRLSNIQSLAPATDLVPDLEELIEAKLQPIKEEVTDLKQKNYVLVQHFTELEKQVAEVSGESAA